MRKEFCKYIFPAMCSFLLSGIYSIVDGIFVGNAVGDNGLAGINLAWPLVAFMIALGTGIGIGGSVIISLNKGAKKDDIAKKAEGNTILLLIGSSLLLVLTLWIAGDPLLKLLGAKGMLHEYALVYLKFLLPGALFQICTNGLLPLIRNKGATIFAMFAMAGGCITNILLDWLFVIGLQMEMKGAALATVGGQTFTIILCVIYYLKKEKNLSAADFIPSWHLIKSITIVGVSPFGLTYLPSVTIIFMNLQTLKYGGNVAVSAYAVLSYIYSFMELLIQGISDGSQPLLSLCQGSNDKKKLNIYKRWMYLLAGNAGVLSGILIFLLRNKIPLIYGTSSATSMLIINAAPAISLSLMFFGITKGITSYFYATNKTKASTAMVYGEVIITAALIYILPLLFSLDGVWFSIPVTQIIVMCMGLLFSRSYQKKYRNKGEPEFISM